MSIECIDSALFKSILRYLQETDAKVDTLQKTIAAFRAQVEDFRSTYEEDNDKLERRIWELRFLAKERY